MPGFDTFKFLAEHAPYQLFRYAMDWDAQYESLWRAPKEWERREPGSLKGVLNAFAYAISAIKAQGMLVGHDIKQIHARCRLADVKKYCPLGEYRKHYVIYAVTQETASNDGLEALFKSNDKDNYLRHIILMKFDDTLQKSLGMIREKLNTYPGYLCLATHNKGFSDEELEGLMSDDTHYSDDDALRLLSERYQASIEDEVNLILRELSLTLSGEIDKDKQLYVIAEAVQKLEHVHPFYDCNCRTFCMVMLNTYLMYYGFLPALLDDPNKFDAHSVDELVILIQEGMQRTKDLCQSVSKDMAYPREYDPHDCTDVENWTEVHPLQRRVLAGYATELVELMMKSACLCLPESDVVVNTAVLKMGH